MSDRFQDLPAYAFPRLRALLDAHAPGGPVVPMSIGEPTHPMPPFVGEVLAESLGGFAHYPVNEGTPELLDAIAAWVARRYGVALSPDRLLALNGTREGLFNAVLALCPEPKGERPVVLLPNPFYGAYLAGALAAGAEPVLLPATEGTGHLPDLRSVPAHVLDRTALAFVASPSNPQGAVATRAWWTDALALAERHGFRLLADECYGEIYRDAPPDGVLAAAQAAGADPETALAFHSLSKRSNLPGLRSGFVAGGPRAIAALRALRAYGGAPLPGPLQRVAARAWADEAHVDASRAMYCEKYAVADRVLGGLPGYHPPEAGFFLWLPVPDGEQAALKLWREAGVRVLPGAYLGRDAGSGNPGQPFIRVALVAPPHDVETGLAAIARLLP
jgi:aspartate/methionine/tyrosine aminotransferase